MAEAVQDPLARLVLQTYQGELQRSIHQPDRLAAVYGSYFASRPQDERLNAIVQTAAQLTAAPHAALVLLTASEGRVVAAYDGEVREAPIEDTYCQHHIMQNGDAIPIENALDVNLLCNLDATQVGGVRAYLGVPLIRTGQVIGSLCVWDTKPRQWSKIQIEVLTQLAAQAMQLDEAFSAARAHQAAQET
jgi:GAF domain-containing protein